MARKTSLLFLILLSVSTLCSAQSFKEDNKNYQKKLNKEFKNQKESPLTASDLKKFKKLDFFDLNESYRVKAKLTLNASPQLFKMPTSTDRLPVYSTYGELTFSIDRQEYKLQVYQNQQLMKMDEYEDYLFVPFADETNGYETYGGGRYLDFHIPKDGEEVFLDFNKAYNPYCAYNDKYSCPKVPESNILPIRIEAGVLNWEH